MPSLQQSRVVGILAAATSLACIAVVALFIVVAGALTPGYSHVKQFISELGATGAPFEWWVRLAGFLPAGLLLLTFCMLASVALPHSRGVALSILGLALYAAGYVVAAGFPCDPGCRPAELSTSQIIHNVGGMVGYVLAPAFLFTLARSARSWPGAHLIEIAGYVASGVALLGLLTLSPSSTIVGLSQRAVEAAVLGWVGLLGVYLARRSACASNPRERIV